MSYSVEAGVQRLTIYRSNDDFALNHDMDLRVSFGVRFVIDFVLRVKIPAIQEVHTGSQTIDSGTPVRARVCIPVPQLALFFQS
jgi:hypothetical protein